MHKVVVIYKPRREAEKKPNLQHLDLGLPALGELGENTFLLFKAFSLWCFVAAKSLQSCSTLCHPIDSSPPGSPIPGILQARTLEWVAISFSNAWKWSHSVMSDSSQPHGLQPTRLLHPWDFPGKNTGVGCHCLLWWCFVKAALTI